MTGSEESGTEKIDRLLLKQAIPAAMGIPVLPVFFGLDGVWYSFPLADIDPTLVTWYMLRKEISPK